MKKVIKVILIIFLVILFVVFFLYFAINDVRSEQNITAKYIQNSDYYFRGTIIDNYPLKGGYYRCIIVKPDSIYLEKISETGYLAAYNRVLNEVAFSTGFSIDKSLGGIIPSYVTVDSKQDTILFDKFQGIPITKLNPMRVSTEKEHFERILKERGGNWRKF